MILVQKGKREKGPAKMITDPKSCLISEYLKDM